MVGDKLKWEIRKLYLSFDDAKSYYEKGFIWSFLTLASDLFADDEITKMFEDISLRCLKDEKNFLIDRKNHEKEKNRFMKENKKFFRDNILRAFEMEKVEYHKLPTKEYSYLINILESFLKSQSKDFYLFYKKMVGEERIIMGDASQVCFSSIKDPRTFIFLERFNNIHDVMVLIHELAHAYYYEINDEILINRANLENEIKDEIPSKMMELKFIRYLRAMNFYKSYQALRKEYDYLIYDSDQHRNDFDMIKYVIGSYLAYNLGNRYKIEEYFHHVHKSDFHDLIMEPRSRIEKETKGKVLRK